MKDLLEECGAGYVRIYGGGGGVIVHDEKKELEAYGIAQIFHPDDGRRLGLEGMIEMIIRGCDFSLQDAIQKNSIHNNGKSAFRSSVDPRDNIPSTEIGQALHWVENAGEVPSLRQLGLEQFSRKGASPLVRGNTFQVGRPLLVIWEKQGTYGLHQG